MPHDRRALRLIAVFKFAKALTLLAVAAAAFGLLGTRLRDDAVRWLVGTLASLAAATEFHGLRGALGASLDHVVRALLRWLGAATPGRLEVTGVVALAYAAVLAAEGGGLWLARPWAERFSVWVTASLIPFELWELTRRVTLARVGVLAVNVAVVVYLARRVADERRHRARAHRPPDPAAT